MNYIYVSEAEKNGLSQSEVFVTTAPRDVCPVRFLEARFG